MTDIDFYDHEVVQTVPEDYSELILCPNDIIKAWSLSLFAHEMLAPDGSIKNEKDMSGTTLQRYIEVSEAIKRGEKIAKPVIGIGLMDNIEIGIGREVIVACAKMKMDKIPVYVRNAQAQEVRKLLKV